MSDIPPDMILRLFANWDQWLRRRLLMKEEDVEYSFNLELLLIGLNKRARRVRILNAHPVFKNIPQI
jgi:hypothetical protein